MDVYSWDFNMFDYGSQLRNILAAFSLVSLKPPTISWLISDCRSFHAVVIACPALTPSP